MLSPTVASTPNANSDSPEKSTVDRNLSRGSEPKLRKDANPVEIKHPKAEPQTTRDDAVAAIAPDRREPEASRNRQVPNGLTCTKMLGKCGAVCVANTGRPDCASTICVRLQQQCLNTGCWRGRAFSSCGLIKQ
jgi:hypothetical protein